MNEWNPPSFKIATQLEYKGFGDKPTNEYQAEQIKNGKAFLVEMSPNEYIERICYQLFDIDIPKLFITGVDRRDVEKYALAMRIGDKFPIGYIDYIRKKQEGTHRALAAHLNGYDKIPVYIIK